MISQVLGDGLAVAGMILASSLRQTVLPPSLLGRVGASFRATTGGLLVLGALAGGALGEALGLRAALWVGVAGLAAAPLLALGSPLSAVRGMPAAASGGEEPAGGQG